MSRVIRGDGGEPDKPAPKAGGAKVVAHEVVDARQEAQRLKDQAIAEGAEIVEAARAEAERIREAARLEGSEAGRGEAAALLLRAQSRREALLEETEAALAKLATEAARQVVRAELALAPDRVRDIAADLLARVRRARDLRVRVSEADRARIEPLVPAGATLEVSGDLEPGDVVVETEVGELDARVEVQLEALRRALEGS